MGKPDDVPQWAWDAVDDEIYDIRADPLEGGVDYESARIVCARLVAKAMGLYPQDPPRSLMAGTRYLPKLSLHCVSDRLIPSPVGYQRERLPSEYDQHGPLPGQYEIAISVDGETPPAIALGKVLRASGVQRRYVAQQQTGWGRHHTYLVIISDQMHDE